MSDSVNIFIGYRASLTDLIQEIEPLLGIEFTFVPAEDTKRSDYYEYFNEDIALEIADASGFVNDRDLRFEEYQYYISINSNGFGNWGENARVRDTFAQELFRRLKSARRYPLLMVFNMETRWDEYTPERSVPASVLSR